MSLISPNFDVKSVIFPNFGQRPFPKIAGKSSGTGLSITWFCSVSMFVNWLHAGKFSCFCCRMLTFQTLPFQIILSGTLSECQNRLDSDSCYKFIYFICLQCKLYYLFKNLLNVVCCVVCYWILAASLANCIDGHRSGNVTMEPADLGLQF